jgi:lipopolysaccharide export system permease protein
MIGYYLWQRYFWKEGLKVFTLALASFLFLFALIDYAFNARLFLGAQVPWHQVLLYYPCNYSKRAAILVAFCVLLATIKVLTTSNLNRELIALMAGGVAKKRLLGPFFGLAIGCTMLLYVNEEWLKPLALRHLEQIDSKYVHQKTRKGALSVNAIALPDGTHLIYQSFDHAKNAFYDLFWLRSSDDIYHMKYLLPKEGISLGLWVDHLVRNDEGSIVKAQSFPQIEFPALDFTRPLLQQILQPAAEQPLSELAHHAFFESGKGATTVAELRGTFFARLLSPLLCLLAVLAVAPYCIRYDRNFPLFMIYAASIAGFVIVYTLINAATIVAINGVFTPLVALVTPIGLLFLIFGVRYLRWR